MTKIAQEATRAQYINKIWAARIQLDKKETLIVRGREIKPIAWSALDLLSEAMRLDGHIPHVKKTLPPGILYACSDEVRQNPLKVAELAEEWADSRKTVTGRAHQRNSPVMAGVVISLPKEMIEDWPAFRDASVKWMKEKYGERLRLIIEHLDEENPHIHAYLVASHGFKDGRPFSEPFGAVHEGYAESRAARRGSIEKSGTSKGAKTGKAFVDAMKEYQDKFQHDVARHFNLARLGPQMKKLSHAEAVRQRDIRNAEAERIEAEKLKEKAFEEVRAAMEARRLANEEIARRKKEAEREAEAISRQMIEDAQERAKVEGQRIMKIAKLAAEEKERTIQALIKGDERVAVRVFKENVKLKEDLRLIEHALEVAKLEIEHWKNKFQSAYSWLKEAVGKLETFSYFGMSHIFKKTEAGGKGSGIDSGQSLKSEIKAEKKLFVMLEPVPKKYKNGEERC
ncbi:hypothetical protein [Massilia sp. LC238]|uniref:hypothetical protein n=1 Tax=Massilia sp. LC238 TaxID=1502852 RepID=UPI0004E3C04E|nr:hypothetical protein [Massilia sp. LC238]KFC61900.1 hypothetical protein FG94_04940 [Massilia sp. LC238]